MKKAVKIGAVTLFWIIIWQAVSVIVNQKLLFVSPIDTTVRIFELAKKSDFWISIGNSFINITVGFVLAVIFGILLAILCKAFPIANTLISPFFTVIKATPVASFTLMLFLWIKAKYLSMFIAFIMVLPVIFFGIYQGIENTDKKLLEMAKVFGVKKRAVISEIYISSAAPFAVSALSVSVGFAWKSGIAAEVICIANKTVGGNLYNAKTALESADIFAWTAVVIIISKLIEMLTVKLLKRIERAVI